MNRLRQILDLNSSLLASSFAQWRGASAFRPAPQQPQQLLLLYEFENCPYCRLVREALTELDIDVRIRPCPKGGSRFRPEAIERGGKAQFPLLHDPNTDTCLYESDAIIRYLRQQYGQRDPATPLHGLRVAGSSLATATRLPGGFSARPSQAPAQELELYSFEASPFSRPVRERLCELEIPYILRNTGKDAWKDMGPPSWRKKFFPDAPVTGRNRIALLARAGKVQVPYLADPNTGAEMFESQDILAYLDATYAA